MYGTSTYSVLYLRTSIHYWLKNQKKVDKYRPYMDGMDVDLSSQTPLKKGERRPVNHLNPSYFVIRKSGNIGKHSLQTSLEHVFT